jgi:hypothetical protein
LVESDKFYSLITEMLGLCGEAGAEKTILAHSGATILPDATTDTGRHPGEVPNSYPTLYQQCDEFIASPESVDLVILDGGINDVGITWILDPTISETVIEARSRRYCFEEMHSLLGHVTTKFPNAQVVVTGYYSILSDQTDDAGVAAVLVGFGIIAFDGLPIPGVLTGLLADGMRQAVIRNCSTFRTASARDLQQAVDAANLDAEAHGEKDRVFFADPKFDDQNAAFGPASWLYELRTDVFPVTHFLDPVDPLADSRKQLCSDPKCQRASLGHPNSRGARAYASAIAVALGYSYVDTSLACCRDADRDFPYGTLETGLAKVPTGGTLRLRSAVLTQPVRITKGCLIEACGGPVTVGKTQ